MLKTDLLSVKGAKFARKDEPVSLTVEGSQKDKDQKSLNSFSMQEPSLRSVGGDLASYLGASGKTASLQNNPTQATPRTARTADDSNPPLTAQNLVQTPQQTSTSLIKAKPEETASKRPSFDSYTESDPYWKKPPPTNAPGDLVVIHVCDENHHITRDFCCHRHVLVENMRYFERFLGEQQESGYEDIDISVHCDVEIFEWLLQYIHSPRQPPVQIERQLLVSVLISAEFLQMDELVEMCVQQMSEQLNEIIRMHIDLSCLSDKLLTRLASLTPPTLLSSLRDKKDKILSKLFKRRVELDFSRKHSSSSSKVKSMAANLTCCRYCGWIFLSPYATALTCRASPPSIGPRGELSAHHVPLSPWSLTAYLKALHAGGMGWESLYWHVWGACVVVKTQDMLISLLEVDRYSLESDGVLIYRQEREMDMGMKPEGEGGGGIGGRGGGGGGGASLSSKGASPSLYSQALSTHLQGEKREPPSFCLGLPDSTGGGGAAAGGALAGGVKLKIAYRNNNPPDAPSVGSVPYTPTLSLSPSRPPDVLTPEIYDLLLSQLKHLVALSHRSLLQQTMQSMVKSSQGAGAAGPSSLSSLSLLWAEEGGAAGAGGGREEDGERRRGRSPLPRGGRLMSSSLEPRRSASGLLAKARSSSLLPNPPPDPSPGRDSDPDQPPAGPPGGLKNRGGQYAGGGRRARSSSTGKRLGGGGVGTGAGGQGKLPSLPRGGKREGVAMESGGEGGAEAAGEAPSLDPPQQPPELSPYLQHQHLILRSLPSSLSFSLSQTRSPYLYGVSLTPTPPLSLLPLSMEESLSLAQEGGEGKRGEWELDIMREYDEKRTDRLERYLISLRNSNNNNNPPSLASGGMGVRGLVKGMGGRGKGEYYKDRARQAFRCVI